MKIQLSGTLLRFVDYEEEIEFEAGTVGDALSSLAGRYPAVKPALFDGEGKLRGAHRLFLNGEALTSGEHGRAIQATDTVEILTSIAGG